MKEERFSHLDGLRGFAAMQVVFLHSISAFATTLYVPGAGMSFLQIWVTGTPLFFLYDGYSAVYLFFLLSGYVLTHAFLREPDAVGKNVLRRLVRLGVPVMAAVLLGFVLFKAWPGESQRVAALTDSGWLRDTHTASAPTIGVLESDLIRSSLFLGYKGASVFSNFPALAAWLNLDSSRQALNVPLWTLHLEFYGSLLIIFLVWLRAHSRLGYLGALLFFAMVMGPHPLFLFVVGHLAYLVQRRWAFPPGTGGWLPLLGASAAIAVGISICSRKNLPLLNKLFDAVNPHFNMPAQASPYFQSQIGAVLIFISVLLLGRLGGGLDPVTRFLNSRMLQWAGKYSFDIYLVHFPIIFTIDCAAYLALAPYLSRRPLGVLVILGGLVGTVCAALLMYRWVDRPAIAWSRRIAKAPKTNLSDAKS